MPHTKVLCGISNIPAVHLKKPAPAFKVTVDVVDIVQKKRIARATGYGQTLEVLDDLQTFCRSSVRGGGRYVCGEPRLFFLRYGHKDCTRGIGCQWTFFEEPEDLEDLDEKK